MSDKTRSTLKNGTSSKNDKLITARAMAYLAALTRTFLPFLFSRNIERFFEINFAEFTNIEVERIANLLMTAWFKSWIVAFPIVLIVAPLTQLFDGKLVVGATR